jgi:hypothetical protein
MHRAGCQGAVLHRTVHRVACRPCLPVLEPHARGISDMGQKSGGQDPLHGANDGICGHELGVGVKRRAAVVFEQEKIARKVNNQETTEEKTRQADDELLRDRRIVQACLTHPIKSQNPLIGARVGVFSCAAVASPPRTDMLRRDDGIVLRQTVPVKVSARPPALAPRPPISPAQPFLSSVELSWRPSARSFR